ncbi:TetR/AcrR family transcriptional regulator [Acidisoma cellulosilytica]|uniref:TetR/AcrR family transcriptional regulator n=1 Tax=Acidisoma cellulosilyticum TaxID=2802395 RepID=A0A963Z414_9PROT|nr:TetR/AcrR family transcriptional regulator [Acidisoma cellulosilyticum]MCB8882126.1 TetR/AcrR family transcriptional regulator [Acidisoma cellulosilyticum]
MVTLPPDGETPARKLGGKPRRLNRVRALDQAMKLFWEQGYEGTSFKDLIAKLKVSPSSFYFAFGSKEALYREVVDCYAAGPAAFFAEVIEARMDARSAFVALMEGHATLFTMEDCPAGCLVSFAFAHAPPELASLRDLARGIRHWAENAMADRLRRGVAEGDLPSDIDAAGLAAFFEAVIRGMAIKATDGATRDSLFETGRLAMQAWPR